MAVQFAQPYRFTQQQLARMAEAGVLPSKETVLIDGVPYRRGTPIRFSGEDYERLGEVGVLGPNERVELIRGEVISMSPVGGPHSTCVFDLDDYLHAVVGPEIRVAMNANLRLPDGTDVVPDLMLLRRDTISRGKPPPSDACMLAVEVADSSVDFDLNDKADIYAWARIPEYWVVDLNRNVLVHHLRPLSAEYLAITEYSRGSSFTSPALGGREVRVDDLLCPG
jgi:Uma2 family endonuclease